jgi:hypothetical protein
VRYSNTLQLPAAYVKAVTSDPYHRGNSDISVTQLIGPPRLRLLKSRHDDELVEDVADRVWSLLGQIAHGILERAAGWASPQAALDEIEQIIGDFELSPQDRLDVLTRVLKDHRVDTKDIQERRLYREVLGWVVSGQIDLMAQGHSWGIGDWKLSSVWTWILGGRREWESQLNCYAWLARHHGHHPEWLRIYVIFRDWSKAQLGSNPNYPDRPIKVIDIPMWTPAFAERYVEGRVRLHQEAEMLVDSELPYCTDEERWARPATWAVIKPGATRARRVLPSEAEAIAWRGEDDTDLEIEYRPGESVRCESYCPVAHLCNQRKEEIGDVIV